MNMRMQTAVVFFLLCAGLQAESAYQAWTKHRDSVKADPSIVGYYTFEDFDGMKMKNLAGAHHAFTTDSSTLVPGRFPEKDAVLIDGGYFSSLPGQESFDIRGKSFTFECWLMKQTAGDDSKNGAMIFNYLTGYYSGWRITTGFPNGPICLQIGRPPGATAFSTSSAADGVWHHVVATWNGQEVRMYLDGKLCSTMKYDGPYVQSIAGFPSLIGRPGWGVGRGMLVIDELAIYGRALTEEEVKEHFLVGGGAQVTGKGEIAPDVAVTFPKATGGYFPVGTNIQVGFTFAHKEKKYTAHFTVLDGANQAVSRDKAVVASKQNEPVCRNINVPDQCGIYWLLVTVDDQDKKLLYRREFPFGVTVKLPDIKDVSGDSPLGIQSWPDGRFYGMKWNRALAGYGTTWQIIEKTQGTYDWTAADQIVNDVTGNGQAMFYFIHGVPNWAAKMPARDGGGTYGPKNVEDMQRFIKALVNRYKDRVHYWEVWNETDCNVHVPGDGTGSDAAAVEYVRILKATYEAIKEVDPTAKVVGLNSCPGFLAWTPKVLKAGGGAYLDIMGYHDYIPGNPSKYLAAHRPVEKLKDIIQSHLGRQVPLWNDETAYHQPHRVDGRPMTEEYFLKHFEMTPGSSPGNEYYIEACLTLVPEHRSACWEIQATLLDFAAGVEKRILHITRGLHGCPNEKGVAFAALAKVVGKKTDIRQFDAGTEQARGVLITDADGKRTAVLWSVDNRPALVSLVLPDDGHRYSGMDFLGNPVDCGEAQQGLLTLKLTQAPLYVFDVPAKLSGVRVMDIEGKPVAAANVPYSGEIIIRNPLNKTMRAVIRPELPAGWQAEVVAEVAVPTGGTTNVPFILRSAEKMEGLLPVRFALLAGNEPVAVAESSVLKRMMRMIRNIPKATANRNEPVAVAELSVLMRMIKNIPKATVNIVLNGEIEKWKGIKCFKAGAEKEEQVVFGRRNPLIPVERPCWQGASDLSFTVSSAWNTNVLYLLVEVTDDDGGVAPEGKDNSAYYYDCVEIFVDIRSNPADITMKAPGAVQLVVVPALTDKASGCRTVYLGSGIEAKFVGRKTAKGYLVEGRIHPVPGSGLSIVEGLNIGLDVAVDDASAVPGIRKTQMALFGSWSNYDKPSCWGRFFLEK